MSAKSGKSGKSQGIHFIPWKVWEFSDKSVKSKGISMKLGNKMYQNFNKLKKFWFWEDKSQGKKLEKVDGESGKTKSQGKVREFLAKNLADTLKWS